MSEEEAGNQVNIEIQCTKQVYDHGADANVDDDDENDVDDDEICFSRYLWVNFESLSPYSQHLRRTYRGIGKYAMSVLVMVVMMMMMMIMTIIMF